MKYNIYIVLIAALLVGCQFNNPKTAEIQGSGDIVQTNSILEAINMDSIPKSGRLVDVNPFLIDISRNYPQENISLQSIADIEYIPLETTDTILLDKDAKIAYVSDNYVVIWQRRQAEVFVFNRNGKIHSHIKRKGPGPEEYTYLVNVVFDEKNEEIFLIDFGRILVYSNSGEYKRILRISMNSGLNTFYNFDDETILMYDEYGEGYMDTYNEMPYVFISKKDGSIVSVLNYRLPVRYSNMFIQMQGQNEATAVAISLPYNRHFGDEFIIADISSDTIYRLTKNRDMTPMIVRKPSVHDTSPITVLVPKLITDKFIVLHRLTIDFIDRDNRGRSMADFLYEFETGKISNVRLGNEDIPWFSWNHFDMDIPRNMTALLLQTQDIKDQFSRLNGELKQLAPSLNYEDNPVLMIVKFK